MTHLAGTDGSPRALGEWLPNGPSPTDAPEDFRAALGDPRKPVIVLYANGGFAVARGGIVALGMATAKASKAVVAYLPPLHPEQLGDPAFMKELGVRYPYMTGAMANGIGSVEIVEAMSKAGMLGSFGAAGLSLERIGASIDRLKANLGDRRCVSIHSPNEPARDGTSELLLGRTCRWSKPGVPDLTPAIVRYRVRVAASGVSFRPIGSSRRFRASKCDEVQSAIRTHPEEPSRSGTSRSSKKRKPRASSRGRHHRSNDSGGHRRQPTKRHLPTILATPRPASAQFSTRPPASGRGRACTPSGRGAFAMGATTSHR